MCVLGEENSGCVGFHGARTRRVVLCALRFVFGALDVKSILLTTKRKSHRTAEEAMEVPTSRRGTSVYGCLVGSNFLLELAVLTCFTGHASETRTLPVNPLAQKRSEID